MQSDQTPLNSTNKEYNDKMCISKRCFVLMSDYNTQANFSVDSEIVFVSYDTGMSEIRLYHSLATAILVRHVCRAKELRGTQAIVVKTF